MKPRYDPDMVLYRAMKAEERRNKDDAKLRAATNKLLKQAFFEDMDKPLFMDFLKGKKRK